MLRLWALILGNMGLVRHQRKKERNILFRKVLQFFQPFFTSVGMLFARTQGRTNGHNAPK